MSVYELHLGSWRPGLGYRDARRPAHRVRQRARLHARRVHAARRAPVRRLVGLPGHRLLRADQPLRPPRRPRYLIDRLHQAGIGVLMDWVPGHFPKDEWALAQLRRRSRSTSTPTRAAASSWTGAPSSSTSATRQVRNFLVANALYWLEEFHIDGLRVDAVASMLYLDYSRKEGEWLPNSHGGRENLEAISFLQEVNATAYKRNPGIVMIAEESTSWPGVTTPTVAGRPRLRPQVEHGLDARLARSTCETTRCTARYHHNEITFSFLYAFSENFLLPISHDEVVHGKGSLLRQDARRPLAEARERARLPRLHVGAPRQAAALHGPGVRPAVASGARSAASTGGSSTSPRTAACSTSSARSTASTARTRRSGRATTTRPASSGSTAAPPSRTSSRSCAGTATATPIAVHRELLRQPASATTASACRSPARWDEIINTDAAEYGGSGVGNFGRRRGDGRRRGPGARPRPSSRCRRSAGSG